ncbi:MAG: hypothetical protein QHJ73_04640, partial [Armatimonadota bacterium]|nr:hypothetical protein [Armatimonadota bacterium]
GTQRELTLARNPSGYYEAVLRVPPNTGTQIEVYTVSITAGDLRGNVAGPTAAGTLTLYPDTSPPPPPPI